MLKEAKWPTLLERPKVQNIDTFNSNLSTAILIVGGAGVGKTSLGMRLYPGTYVFVADLNFQSGIDYLKQIDKLSNIVGYDNAVIDETGKIIPPNYRYDRMWRLLNEATKNPLVDCILIDSAMFIEDIIKAKICGAITEGGIRLDGFKQWGDLILIWKSLIMQLRASGKKLVMVAHENKDRDESDQIWKYNIAVEGSIRAKLPALFSDVWRCEIAENMGKHTWNIRMLSNSRQEHLKRSSSFSKLPPVLTQDELVKTINEK